MNLDELAKQYGGVSATPESVNLDELAKKLGGTSRPVKERTVGEAFTDPAAKFASGIGQLIQQPGQIYGLVTGAIKDKDWKKMRGWVVNNLDNDPVSLFRKIYDTFVPLTNQVPQLVLTIADYQYKSAFVADQEINLVACLTEIMASVELK